MPYNLSVQVTARAGPILNRLGILKINRFYWNQRKPWLPLTSSLRLITNFMEV